MAVRSVGRLRLSTDETPSARAAKLDEPFVSVHDGFLVSSSFDPEMIRDAFRKKVKFDCELHI